jgi:hypothetical protein
MRFHFLLNQLKGKKNQTQIIKILLYYIKKSIFDNFFYEILSYIIHVIALHDLYTLTDKGKVFWAKKIPSKGEGGQ